MVARQIGHEGAGRRFASSKSWQRNIYIIAIVYALIVMAIFPKWTVDDAYIIFRYADNFANHSELTWNIGEDPIEGYTGIALPVILAFFLKFGLSPLLVSKVIGIISYFLGGYVLHLLLRKLEVHWLAQSIVQVLYFTIPISFVHVWSGMETVMFSTLLVICIYTLLNCLTSSEQKGIRETWFILFLLFLSFVRPEGVVLAGTSFIVLSYLQQKYDKKEFWPFVIRFIILYIVPGLIYFIWRWQHYGQFLPNTFYAKSSAAIFNKWSIIKLALFSIFYLSVPTIICLVLDLTNFKFVKEQIKERYSFMAQPKFLIACLAIVAFAVLVNFQYLRSRLLMNFEYRFFAPFFPVFLIFFGVLLSFGFYALKEIRKNKPVMYRVIVILMVILFTIQLSVNVSQLNRYMYLKESYISMMDNEHIPVGLFLRANVPSSEWLIVINDAGAIPYYSKLKTVDFSRLNDEVLLKKNLSSSEILDYFYSFNAGAVVITSSDWDKIYQPWIYGSEAELIADDPRFEQYALVRKYKTNVPPENPAHDYFLFLFLRKDLYHS